MWNCEIFVPLVCLIYVVPSSGMTVTITTTTTLSPRVLQPCNVDDDCPVDASCRVRNPDGQLCICNKGFVANAYHRVCEKANCSELAKPSRGIITFENQDDLRPSTFECTPGTVVTLQCLQPKLYELRGPTQVTCQSSGLWNPNPPICVPINGTTKVSTTKTPPRPTTTAGRRPVFLTSTSVDVTETDAREIS